jgi:signal transduction histidine kinase
MTQPHTFRRFKPSHAWIGAFIVAASSLLLGLLAWHATQTQQRQADWERKEALTLQARALTDQLLHQLSMQTSHLWTMQAALSPQATGTRLAKRHNSIPWIWHTVVLSEQSKLLYPSMPWEHPTDKALLRASHTETCRAFQTRLRTSKAGQAARLSASWQLLQRLPNCPLRKHLRVPLLHDAHMRHASKRTWLMTSSQEQSVWQLRSPDYVIVLRRINRRWVGFAIALQTALPLLPTSSPFRTCWLRRITSSPTDTDKHTISIPLVGQLAGYSLSFQSDPPTNQKTWQIGAIIFFGVLFIWLALATLLVYLHQRQRWDEQRSALFAAIAHELKTPVAAQLNLLGNLRRQSMNPASQPYQEALFKETKRLQQLIDNLLALNRLTLSPLTNQRTNITALTHEVLESVEHLADEKEQRLTCDDRTPHWVTLDPVGLELVLRNLIDNAIKYTPAHGDIGISIQRQHERITWSIQDDGFGIPVDTGNNIFQPFVRGESRSQPGSGLGLYIAQSIARQSKGNLTLDEQYTKGARFVMTLPATSETSSS